MVKEEIRTTLTCPSSLFEGAVFIFKEWEVIAVLVDQADSAELRG
jgi:hypothetical protein